MPGPSIPVGRINADVFTSPHASPDMDPTPAVVAAIGTATKTLHIAIYSLTSDAIAQAILGAYLRGVAVVIVADAVEAKVSTSKLRMLADAGIDIRLWGSAYRLMHDKVLIVDGLTPNAMVGLGSFNFTTQAEKSNVEVLLIVRGIQASRILAPVLIGQIVTTHDGGKPLAAAQEPSSVP